MNPFEPDGGDPAPALGRVYALLRRHDIAPAIFFATIAQACDDEDPMPDLWLDTGRGLSAPQITASAIEAGRSLIGTVDADTAAKFLHVTLRTVHDRVKGQELVGYILGGQLRLPLWQFTPRDRVPIRHLAALVPTIMATDLAPVALARYMTSSQPELLGLGPLSPVAWLSRFTPARVLAGLRSAAQGGGG